MLQIRLSKPANESGGVSKSLPPETVTVACPDHLVISDLPVAKSLGTVNPSSQLKTVGRRSRRQLGERVHICVRCDFPIAVYGRLGGETEVIGKMLRIILDKRSNESGVKQLPPETVRVSCPDHLVLADLPVAKSLGSVNPTSAVKIVGRRSLRPPGKRVKCCFRCDFPIAVYGRLSPCEHIFCLDCARSDALCYLWHVKRIANNVVIYRGYAADGSIWGTISCDERIQKIQTIKMLEGVFICAAPHCLKSFLKKTELESHIHENHSDLLKIAEKDGNIPESASARKPAASESALQPPRSIFSPSSGSQVHDHEDKAHDSLTRDQQPPRPFMQQKAPFTGSSHNHPLEQQSDSNPPPGFERPGMQNRLPQQGGDAQGSLRPDPGHFPDKQQGIMGSSPFPEYPMDMPQPHGFAVPMGSNPGLAPQFVYPPFAPDGAQPFYGAASFEMPRPDSTPERGSEQGSLLGFPPGAAGNVNFPENYPRPWNMGQLAGPFESTAVQPPPDGFVNAADSQGRHIFFQGEYGRNVSVVPSNLPPPPSANRGLEGGQSSTSKDTRDSKGILMPQPMPLPPPPPLPRHVPQLRRGGRRYSGDTSHDGQGYGWQHEKRDDFRSRQH